MLTKEKAATPDQVAVRLFATVGERSFARVRGKRWRHQDIPMDIMLDQAPYYYTSYAMVQGREDLQLRRMNEEHGILTSTTGKVNLKVGQVLELMPFMYARLLTCKITYISTTAIRFARTGCRARYVILIKSKGEMNHGYYEVLKEKEYASSRASERRFV